MKNLGSTYNSTRIAAQLAALSFSLRAARFHQLLRKLESLTKDELVTLFVEVAKKQGVAVVEFETAKFNRLFNDEVAVVNELRRRPGDERHALLDLYSHDHLQVRLNAIKSTYALDPRRAEAGLRGIVESRRDPWAFEARMSLSLLETGTSQLQNDPWIEEK